MEVQMSEAVAIVVGSFVLVMAAAFSVLRRISMPFIACLVDLQRIMPRFSAVSAFLGAG
jgi:hypothetical protein